MNANPQSFVSFVKTSENTFQGGKKKKKKKKQLPSTNENKYSLNLLKLKLQTDIKALDLNKHLPRQHVHSDSYNQKTKFFYQC